MTLSRTKEIHWLIDEGCYELLVELQVGTGVLGFTPQSALPEDSVGLAKLDLMKVQVMGDNTIDTAIVNPQKKPVQQKT